jgi:hypothetical protein
VKILITVVEADDDVAELHSLFDALVEDDELVSASKHLVTGTAHAATLGADESIQVIVESGALWGALSTTLISWLQMRRPRLRIRLTRGDGTVAEINATGTQAVESVAVDEALKVVRGTSDGQL